MEPCTPKLDYVPYVAEELHCRGPLKGEGFLIHMGHMRPAILEDAIVKVMGTGRDLTSLRKRNPFTYTGTLLYQLTSLVLQVGLNLAVTKS
jgi:hypothetical protein